MNISVDVENISSVLLLIHVPEHTKIHRFNNIRKFVKIIIDELADPDLIIHWATYAHDVIDGNTRMNRDSFYIPSLDSHHYASGDSLNKAAKYAHSRGVVPEAIFVVTDSTNMKPVDFFKDTKTVYVIADYDTPADPFDSYSSYPHVMIESFN